MLEDALVRLISRSLPAINGTSNLGHISYTRCQLEPKLNKNRLLRHAHQGLYSKNRFHIPIRSFYHHHLGHNGSEEKQARYPWRYSTPYDGGCHRIARVEE
jgi:hypothetical protein